MKLRVLGCSGGIAGRSLHTSALLVDDDILIDAGTGVCELSIEEMLGIDHVFLTHAHLDHIAALPLMIDSVADRRQHPLTVHGSEAVIASLRKHIFNWEIWPDFSALPQDGTPFMRFEPFLLGQSVRLDGRCITPLPVDHTVPAVAYCIDSGAGSLVFSGDTGNCDAFWQAVNRIHNLRYLLIECAFSNAEHGLALVSKHLCPDLLGNALKSLERDCEIYITHLKPGRIAQTMAEIDASLARFKPQMLLNNQIFEF